MYLCYYRYFVSILLTYTFLHARLPFNKSASHTVYFQFLTSDFLAFVRFNILNIFRTYKHERNFFKVKTDMLYRAVNTSL